MPTRRDFLQSALLLPAALTTGKVFAEDTSKPNAAPTTDVFADFESGNYEGWTIEGDAFGTAPATDALFPGKIRGFTGRGFLCSLHPRKGNAATGKAISKEFTIEKSFITFKIGGGNHPNQACLNLIVDNQIVYTATGDGTANLSESSFDVSNLVGRKAHKKSWTPPPPPTEDTSWWTTLFSSRLRRFARPFKPLRFSSYCVATQTVRKFRRSGRRMNRRSERSFLPSVITFCIAPVEDIALRGRR